MAREITLHFGEDGSGAFPEYKIGNSLIVGKTGSGKSVLLTNILAEFVLRYNQTDIIVDMFDGKGMEFVTGRGSTGIEFCEIAMRCVNYAESTIETFIETTYDMCEKRVKNLTDYECTDWNDYNERISGTGSGMRTEVVFIEEFDASIEKLPKCVVEELLNKLAFIMKNAHRTGLFIVISSHRVGFMDTYKCLQEHFDIVACTRADEDASYELFGSDVAATQVGKFGKVCVRGRDKDVNILNVPFYYKKNVINGIIHKTILPKGVMFDDDKLAQFAKFIGSGL